MSSEGLQKLFCGIYSAFKCSFDEFLGEKVFSLSYSSAILAPPRINLFKVMSIHPDSMGNVLQLCSSIFKKISSDAMKPLAQHQGKVQSASFQFLLIYL